jgi:hypothetical protein
MRNEFQTTLTIKQLQKIKTAFKTSKDVQIQLSYDQLTNNGGFNPPGAKGAGPNKILLTSEQQQKIEKCIIEGKKKISKNQHATGVKIILSYQASGGIVSPLLEIAARKVAASVASLIENEAEKIPILGTILKHQKASGELAEIARKSREAPDQPLPTVNGQTIDRKMLQHMFSVDGGMQSMGCTATPAELPGTKGAGGKPRTCGPGPQAIPLSVAARRIPRFHPLSTKDFIKEGIPVFMRDTMPPDTAVKTQYGVVNHDSINGKGTHWVCFFHRPWSPAPEAQHIDDGAVYYFDPYGNANPPKELVKVFEGREIRYNKEHVQKMEEDHPICGHLCIAFLKMMEEGQEAGEVLNSLKAPGAHLAVAKALF